MSGFFVCYQTFNTLSQYIVISVSLNSEALSRTHSLPGRTGITVAGKIHAPLIVVFATLYIKKLFLALTGLNTESLTPTDLLDYLTLP